jgi:hypothetical protein
MSLITIYGLPASVKGPPAPSKSIPLMIVPLTFMGMRDKVHKNPEVMRNNVIPNEIILFFV